MRRQHFVFLDGMRGLAAIAVAVLHASELFNLQFVPSHARLAVDFFFCLSGFVVAYAYDRPLSERMDVSDFSIKRFIRLYPMLLVGVIFGGLVTYLERLDSGHSTHDVLTLTLTAMVLVPFGLFSAGEAYPVNNPIWSLAFEFLANGVYAVERRLLRLPRIIWIGAMVVAAVALLMVIHSAGQLLGVGYGNPKLFVFGLARVIFPFFGGVLIYRFSLYKLSFKTPSVIPAAILIAMLASPLFMGSGKYDAASVLIVTPLLVILGANVETSGRMSQLWTLLGKLSYPFYIVHQPTIRAVALLGKALGAEAYPTVVAGLSIIAAVIVSLLLLILYDEPVRASLGRLYAKVGHGTSARTA